MGLKAGALLWHRMRITLPAATTLAPSTLNVDTGLTQPNRSFESYSPGEPPLGVVAAVPPPDGTPPASRIQVIPMAPLAAWTLVTHGEPYLDTDTDTIHVLFTNSGPTPIEINALFWDPHSMVGPGEANTYHPGQ